MKKPYELHEKKYKELLNKGILNWDDAQRNKSTLCGIEKETLIFLEKLISKSLIPKKGDVLEIGCGTGPLLRWFCKHGYRCVGVDISETAIKVAKQNQEKPRIEYFCDNILDWRSKSGQKFDLIIDGHCLHCIPYKDERKKIIQNIRGSLKEGGRFVLLSMCKPINKKILEKKLGELFFDKNILYAPAFDAQEFKSYIVKDNVSYIPMRYIASSDSIIKEMEMGGFKCDFFKFENNTEEDCNASLMAVFQLS